MSEIVTKFNLEDLCTQTKIIPLEVCQTVSEVMGGSYPCARILLIKLHDNSVTCRDAGLKCRICCGSQFFDSDTDAFCSL